MDIDQALKNGTAVQKLMSKIWPIVKEAVIGKEIDAAGLLMLGETFAATMIVQVNGNEASPRRDADAAVMANRIPESVKVIGEIAAKARTGEKQ